ncbi:hypothetical protein MTR67_026970 [Solanum verrucosum]|uniref:Uncharacterized protein n=1 Tax=Solanum verrucosum TaxID=315347 RepID=A0AAF0R6I9_SOLVR|nr:hypothetical protein MTR67_026970 [Solanum verrucosum]
MMEKECLSYLARIHDLTKDPSHLETMRVVREFMDVFPTNLPSVPQDRDIDFYIDLEPGTRPISISPYQIALTSFKNRYGSYEFVVMSFGLTNSPTAFIELRNRGNHVHLLRIILQSLREDKLYEKISKCEFWLESVAFLGHVVTKEGIMGDQAKKTPSVGSLAFLKAEQRPLALEEQIGTKLELSTIFHPQSDGKYEQAIHMLEDMLWACVMDFVGH